MKQTHKTLSSAGLLLLVAFAVTGCSTQRWVNTGGYWLESVNTPDHIANPFLTEKGVYVDDSLSVKMEMWDDGFDLNIKNLGKNPIGIRWDKCSYTDELGESHEIIHMKNRYMINGWVLKGGESYNDFIAPADALTEGIYDDELTPLWRIHTYRSKEAAEAARPDSSSVNVTLVVQRGTVQDDYIFKFVGDDYQTSKVDIINEERSLFAWDFSLLSIILSFIFVAILI